MTVEKSREQSHSERIQRRSQGPCCGKVACHQLQRRLEGRFGSGASAQTERRLSNSRDPDLEVRKGSEAEIQSETLPKRKGKRRVLTDFPYRFRTERHFPRRDSSSKPCRTSGLSLGMDLCRSWIAAGHRGQSLPGWPMMPRPRSTPVTGRQTLEAALVTERSGRPMMASRAIILAIK
jgi:hypothetical protein